MTAARGVFIGQRKDRMGARLLMMLTCIRLAEDFGADYKVNWFPKGADAPELDTPSELFTQSWMDMHFLDAHAFDALTQDALPVWSFLGDKSPDRLQAHLAVGRSVLVEEGFEVLAFPWEDIETIRPRYRNFIHRIGFAEDIRAVMEQADARLSGQGVSAYHIRRGDILNGEPWKHTTWPAKIEPEELYEAHLEKTKGQTAIMFSDQPELIARFQSKFPQLLQMSDIADLSSLSRAKRDFLELYTMSRADQVIAPAVSAFSMAASRIAGSQSKMFREVLSESELTEAHEKVVERLRNGPSGFINGSEAAHIYAKATFHLYSLHSADRAQEAADITHALLDTEADNAFLPLLQAINFFYLQRWGDALRMADLVLENPNTWPEDYAVARALRAATLGGQKKRWNAAREFSQAFWAKPLRPDITIFGSRLLFRDQLAYRALPPADWAMQRAIRRSWFNYNAHIAQRKVISRRPCNFDLLLLDWAFLSVDEKARRLPNDRDRLQILQDGLLNMTNLSPLIQIPENSPSYRSLSGALQLRLGETNLTTKIDQARRVCKDCPDNPLFYKRLCDLYEADGEIAQARLTMAEALACDPDNPFLIFAMGQFLTRNNAVEQGQSQIIQAADLDDNTAAIQGEAGQILLRRGDRQQARRYLKRARDLCPTFKKFSNQLKRAGGDG
ncbi:tetratricopeptide repeat protein [Ruegeria lacuscaerulensis]|uniref:tetratricopeptide repeat protein n=1 Tax=Ruegeria lacuscaerulensis TaxID=55218 RepID=UPI00148084FB|nr:hypothetical protein [Ruegeria lacuscaerulensis]